MFSREAYVPLQKFLKPDIRYMGTDENILNLQALKNTYQVVAEHLKLARNKRDFKPVVSHATLNQGASVLIKNHTAGP